MLLYRKLIMNQLYMQDEIHESHRIFIIHYSLIPIIIIHYMDRSYNSHIEYMDEHKYDYSIIIRN